MRHRSGHNGSFSHRVRSVAALLVFAIAPAALACNIPVFRYALERWPPERYQVLVFHNGPLGPVDRRMADELSDVDSSHANIDVVTVDVATAKLEPGTAKLWASVAPADGGALSRPLVVVRSLEQGPLGKPLYVGALDPAALAAVLRSPARERIGKELLGGRTAVFVLIESGDKSADDAAAALVEKQLRAMEQAIELPRIDPNDPGPRLMSVLPLKVTFAIQRVSRQDAGERTFVANLLEPLEHEAARAVAKGKAPATQPAMAPVVVPIFGQGRALCVLSGKEIDAENLTDICQFLCGACSCQVKELNPGFDLLMCADWQSILDDERVAADRENPAPAGKGANIPDPVIGSGKPKTVPAPQP